MICRMKRAARQCVLRKAEPTNTMSCFRSHGLEAASVRKRPQCWDESDPVCVFPGQQKVTPSLFVQQPAFIRAYRVGARAQGQSLIYPVPLATGTPQPAVGRSTGCPALRLTTDGPSLEVIRGATKWHTPNSLPSRVPIYPRFQCHPRDGTQGAGHTLSLRAGVPASLRKQCVCPFLHALCPV